MKIAAKVPALILLGCTALAGAKTTVHHSRHGAAARSRHAAKGCSTGLAAPVVPAGVPAEAGRVQTAFALRYIDLKIGTGEPVPPDELLTVHYTGWLASDGTKFDSSVDRGRPITFQQGAHRVIPGWDQGFAGMRVGGKRRLFVPYQLGYGDQGHAPVIPGKSDLIFDVELISAATDPLAQPPGPPAPAGAAPKPSGEPSR